MFVNSKLANEETHETLKCEKSMQIKIIIRYPLSDQQG